MTRVSRNPRPARMTADERREQLLDVTLGLIRARGMQGLSVDAVARAAGVTRPLVYTVFGDLDALLDALGDREERQALADVAAAVPVLPDAADPDEVLVRGVGLFLAAVRAEPDRWHLILLPPDGMPARMAARIERNRSAVLAALEELVVWGVRRRGGPAVDPELLARTILTLAQDAARLVLEDPGAHPTERVTGFVRAVLGAIERGPGDPSAPPPRSWPVRLGAA